MNDLLIRFFGINYRTSVLGVGVIFAAVGRLAIAYRTRDFTAMAEDGQLVVDTVGKLLVGFGLLITKDSSVTGVGSQAKTVDSSGTVTNIEGQPVGHQSPVPPQPKL